MDPDPAADHTFLDELVARFAEAMARGEPQEIDDWLRLASETQRPELRSRLAEVLARDASDKAIPETITAGALAAQDEAPTLLGVPPLGLPSEEPTLAPIVKSASDEAPTLHPGSSGDTGVERPDGSTQTYVDPLQTRADGKTYFGDYELLGEIARGGMGIVYKARHVRLNRVVALKMILAGSLAGGDEVQRFHAEAEAAANLDHPGIVPIYEVGQYRGQHYFSMAFVDGQSLAEMIAEQPLPPSEAAAIAFKVTQAIGYAHERGVIHRDLKPANVLVQRNPDIDSSLNGETRSFTSTTGFGSNSSVSAYIPRVTDFGLAKRLKGNDQLTQTGQVLGTPSYMPPEQAAGRIDEINERSDVYSIGGILYALLTGRPPFQAPSHLDTLMQVLEKDPVPPRQLAPNVPRDLETITLKALEKDPKRRYQSAADLSEDLARFIAGEPIKARSISTLERTWRWAMRRPAVASLIVVASLLIAAVMIGGPLVAYRETLLRTEADAKRREAFAAQQTAEAAVELQRIATKEAEQAKLALADEKQLAERKLYARSMALAYQEWFDGNVQRAEDLLDKADDRFRDWEWAYLKSVCHTELRTLRGHAGVPRLLRTTPDGKHLISAGMSLTVIPDPNVYVWELENGNLLRRLQGQCYAISPDAGLVAVRLESNGPLLIQDALTGNNANSLGTASSEVRLANFSSDGRLLVTAGTDRVIRIWQVEDALVVWESERAGDEPIIDLVISADGEKLCWKRETGEVHVVNWRDNSGQLVFKDPVARPDARRLALSPDGSTIASTSVGLIQLYDASSGELIQAMPGHEGSVLDLAFSHDGRWLASCGVDSTVRIWDVEKRIEWQRFRGHKFGTIYGVYAVAFNHDGRQLISGGSDSTIKIWQLSDLPTDSAQPLATGLASPRQELRWLTGHRSYVEDIVYTKDSSKLFSVGQDSQVLIHDLIDETEPVVFDSHTASVGAIALHPNGRWVATGEGGLEAVAPGAILIWDRETHEVIKRLEGHTGPISQLRFNPEGDRLYSSMGSQAYSHRGEFFCWDVERGEIIYRKEEGLLGVIDFDISPEGDQLAIASYRGAIQIIDAKEGTVAKEVGLSTDIHLAVRFSPDGKLLLAGGANWSVALFDLASGTRLWEQIEHSGAVLGLTFNPTGTRCASVGIDRTIKLWDAATGAMLIDYKGDAFQLFGIAFSPDGKSVAAYGEAPQIALRRADNVNEGLDDDASWPEIFNDDFDRTELGNPWTITKGAWAIENAVAVGQLEAIPSATGETTATLGLSLNWLPSAVAIEFDAWAEEPMVFGTMLSSHEQSVGVESLFLGANTSQFNQFRRGLAVVSRMSGGVSQIARLDDQTWFEPGQRYRVKTVRMADQWELWINGRLRLETRIPASLWAPTLQIRGAFGKPDAKVYIDNLAIRVHPQAKDEIDAAKLESELRSKFLLNALVIDALGDQQDVSERVRQLAVRFAGLRQEEPAARDAIIQRLVLNGELDQEAFAALVPQLESEVSQSSSQLQRHQTLAALHYRAGNYREALNALRTAEELSVRDTGESTPINYALLALTWVALGDEDKAERAMLRLREQLRSRHWQADSNVARWTSLAQAANPSIAALDKRVDSTESLRQLSFAATERALVDHEPQQWFDLFAKDATIVRGRGPSASPDDLQLTRLQWQECEALRSSVSPPLSAHLTLNQSDFSMTDNLASETSTYTYTINDQFWRWEVEAQWQQDNSGQWRIVNRREGLVAYYESATKQKRSNEDWSTLDARVAEAIASDDRAATMDAMIAARRYREALDLAKEALQAPNPDSTAAGTYIEAALAIGNAEAAKSMATEVLKKDPRAVGPRWMRSLAASLHVASKPIFDKGGVQVTDVTFFRNTNPGDFNIPAEILRAWFLTPNCATIAYRDVDELVDGKTMDEVGKEITSVYQQAFGVTVLRQSEIHSRDLTGIDLIFRGNGNGLALLAGTSSNRGTIQRIVMFPQGNDTVGALLTTSPAEFDERNGEFEWWLRNGLHISPHNPDEETNN